MQPFNFFRVHTVEDAIRTFSKEKNAKFLGGGTNLVDLLKMNIENPASIIDINPLTLNKVEQLDNGNISVGAMVRNSDLACHPLVLRHFPVLSEALLSGASPQLRNMATVGGNLLQRTRCPYFFDATKPCNKRMPGSGCPAIPGYNRSHAVLGTSDHCIAAHPSDMCVALSALDAIILVHGAEEERRIPITEFYLLPRDTPDKETVLQPGELITAVEIPALPYLAHSHYEKVRDRASFEFALASAAVALDIREGRISAARVALGGVGVRPWRSVEAETALTGRPANIQTFRTAADKAMEKAKTYTHNAFKIPLCKETLVRALTITGGMI